MGFEYLHRLPSADEIKKELPVSEKLARLKESRDEEIRQIIDGRSDKFLLIIGPCSADNETSVAEYCARLRKVQDKVADKLFIVPRVYTNKPRTTGEGYKGMAHQPDPTDAPNIVGGLKAIRKMHIRILAESGFTSADEMLYPSNFPYLSDLLSYVAVGARSVENQQHRLTVSGFDIASGMKNPTSGDLTVMLNSIKAAQLPHEFIYSGHEVRTTGNPWAHAILRGAFTPHGRNIPNYHYEEMIYLLKMYAERNLANPAVIVDCNHANSAKKFAEQPRIAKEVISNMRHSKDIRKAVKGLLIESYLVEGAQDVTDGVYGKSITDPCLGWEASEQLILDLADRFASL
ncbi:MAG: 3-deoxy-7-phosphoheptulonate synthase [Candidatus Omnitrophica bacterium]|nr:3-deoxy-7-phosphoheptulonate synthase [Candidatus Omnitrophota bacterium]